MTATDPGELAGGSTSSDFPNSYEWAAPVRRYSSPMQGYRSSALPSVDGHPIAPWIAGAGDLRSYKAEAPVEQQRNVRETRHTSTESDDHRDVERRTGTRAASTGAKYQSGVVPQVTTATTIATMSTEAKSHDHFTT